MKPIQIELSVSCSSIEEMLHSQYHLDEPVKLTKMEHDEMGDLCVFTLEMDEDTARKINRGWDESQFSGNLVDEAI